MDSLIACHECDVIHCIKPLPGKGVAHCIRPGISLYAFLALIFVLTAMTVSLDSHLIWHIWGKNR